MKESKGNNEKSKSVKKKVIVIFLVIFAITFVSVFGRYVLNRYNEFYSRTKEFYFNSDKLGEDTPVYQLENWSGIEPYTIIINMNSNDNNLISASYDISYNISYTSSDNVLCTLSKTNGVIYSSTNTDQFTLMITPNTDLKTGDRVNVKITAAATSPYKKELSATFNLIVGKETITYEIVDSAGSPYLELNITNTLSYYTVNQAFGSYSVGEKITRDVYMELSDANKLRCSSATITLGFNPNEILLDMTDENYLKGTNITTTLKNSYNYINGLTFRLDAVTSTKVKFYKIDQLQDYTYPIKNSTPIVNVSST